MPRLSNFSAWAMALVFALSISCGGGGSVDPTPPPSPPGPPPPPPPPPPPAPAIFGTFEVYGVGAQEKIANTRVYIHGSGGIDSANVGPDGKWRIEPFRSTEDPSVRMVAMEKSPQSEWHFFRFEEIIPREDFSKNLHYTRVPRIWVHLAGKFTLSQQTWSLEEDAGTIITGASSSFFNASQASDNSGSCWSSILVSWPKTKRPVPVAFDPQSVIVSLEDSLRYWQNTTKLESELGLGSLWRPANFSELGYNNINNNPDWNGILIRGETPFLNATISLALGKPRDAQKALINFRGTTESIAHMGNRWAGPHETLHSLGLTGHVNWQSLMYPGLVNPQDPVSYDLDKRIVTMVQIYYADADKARETGAKSGIPGHHQGERFTLLGIPAIRVCPWVQ